MFNNIDSVMKRLVQGIGHLSDSDVRGLLLDLNRRITELEKHHEEASAPSGSDPVAGSKDSKPGTGKRGRPRKSDAPGAEASGDA